MSFTHCSGAVVHQFILLPSFPAFLADGTSNLWCHSLTCLTSARPQIITNKLLANQIDPSKRNSMFNQSQLFRWTLHFKKLILNGQ